MCIDTPTPQGKCYVKERFVLPISIDWGYDAVAIDRVWKPWSESVTTMTLASASSTWSLIYPYEYNPSIWSVDAHVSASTIGDDDTLATAPRLTRLNWLSLQGRLSLPQCLLLIAKHKGPHRHLLSLPFTEQLTAEAPWLRMYLWRDYWPDSKSRMP